MVMTTLTDEEMSVMTIDMDRKYWLLIPSIGQPVMVSPNVSEKSIEQLVKSELKEDTKDKISYRLLKHEGTIVKHKAGDDVQIPNNKTLLDLKGGDKVTTVAKYAADGSTTKPAKEYEVNGLYWIRLNDKLGYLGCVDDEGNKEHMRLSPDGRDSSGAIAVRF